MVRNSSPLLHHIKQAQYLTGSMSIITLTVTIVWYSYQLNKTVPGLQRLVYYFFTIRIVRWLNKYTRYLVRIPGSMPVQPPDSKVDSVTSILAHRSTQEGGLKFLCLKVEWHSYSELKRRAPQLLTHCVHYASFQNSSRIRKRRTVSEVPLISMTVTLD